MFRLIKQVFITLMSYVGFLGTKCVSLNNKPCMIRPSFINIKSVELSYYPSMISVDKFNGNRYAVDDIRCNC